MNRIQPLSISLGQDLSLLSRQLRQSVVHIGGAGLGGGSGAILSPDGLIVTNAHVATAEHLRVQFLDGRKLEAHIIARNPRRDLALLKVDASGLVPLQIRDVSTMRTGETVLALGFPMGDEAVTFGIVHAASSNGRWLTADIRVAPGNSGGPLCDIEGGLVGINTMVVDGLTLAVSASAVERFISRAVNQQARAAAAD